MQEKQKGNWKQNAALFGIGAVGYCGLELLWRGYTHWSMGLTGGACLVGLYAIYKQKPQRPLALQALAGAGLITAAEFCVGCLVNRWLGWNVWDYSGWKIQLLGQICLVFSALWYLLCVGVFGVFRLLPRLRSLLLNGHPHRPDAS